MKVEHRPEAGPDHRAWLAAEAERLLAFARGAAVPDGFAWLDGDGRADPDQPRELWIAARMTHVFALGHLLGHPDCARLADHGLAAIHSFADPVHGGWFSRLGADAGEKEAYSHAFVLLAAASARVAGRPGAGDLLDRAADVLMERFWSEAEGACRERFDRAFASSEGYRGANANMHMVEAFLAAGEATGAPEWTRRALRIAEKLIDRTAREHRWRVVEHFDAGWRPLSRYNAERPRDPFRPPGVTPGHGFEWARLLLALREALPGGPVWLLEAAPALYDRALSDGREPGGGLVYTTTLDGRPLVRDRMHWVVAEAIGAAATLHAVTGDPRYARDLPALWHYARSRLVDAERGSWRHELDEHDQPAQRTWKGKPDVYHAFQATLFERLPVAPSLAGAAARAAPAGPTAGRPPQRAAGRSGSGHQPPA